MRTRDRSSGGGGGHRQAGMPAPAMGVPGGGERLPTAPRERKPALAALAVLLILLGAFGAVLTVVRASHKESYVEITQSVAAGDPIPESAIRSVDLSDDSGLGLIRWEQRGDLLDNYRAAVTLVPDSILSGNMITKKDNVLTQGKSLVGLSLQDGQFPRNSLSVGDTVAAYLVGDSATKDSGDDSSSSGSGGGSQQSTLISNKLIVKSIDVDTSGNGSGNTYVTVLADTADAGPLTNAASAGNVTLVRIAPASGN
ncbi:hypothetical protein ACH4UA_10320 [Streptomyces sp. NPDC020939]|uniref:hypothetical protein n=2 Tax=Streptomyces TaxID=1883 RepID=UPI003788B720